MIAGASYIPHRDKRPLGEDAFFITKGGSVIGVADGVGSWRDQGVDAGEFARELMCRSASLVGSWPCATTDPVRILEKAASKATSEGTATACIVALKGKRITFVVESGDLVVAGSDGLFDNLFEEELAGMLARSEEGGRERVDDLAYDVAQAALASSLDGTRRTPFSEACREAGRLWSGGKQDDITVVVARVVCTCD